MQQLGQPAVELRTPPRRHGAPHAMTPTRIAGGQGIHYRTPAVESARQSLRPSLHPTPRRSRRSEIPISPRPTTLLGSTVPVPLRAGGWLWTDTGQASRRAPPQDSAGNRECRCSVLHLTRLQEWRCSWTTIMAEI